MKSLLDAPYFVALDMDAAEPALGLAHALKGLVGGYKLGPRLVMRSSLDQLKALAQLGPLFLDFKFYDIPSTTVASVRTAFELGASFVTVHAQCGRESLQKLAELEQELNKKRPFKILAVTVLTSYAPESLPSNWKSDPIESLVLQLADEVVSCGLDGLVCSAHELQSIRARHPEAFLVTPGIRPKGSEVGDQKRVMSPTEALQAGASALVIGRPIYQAENPVEVAQKIFKETRS